MAKAVPFRGVLSWCMLRRLRAAPAVGHAPEIGSIARQTGTTSGHRCPPLTALVRNRIMRHLFDEVIL
jgi:hypothetical protein